MLRVSRATIGTWERNTPPLKFFSLIMRVLSIQLMLVLLVLGSTGYRFGGRAKRIGAKLKPPTPIATIVLS